LFCVCGLVCVCCGCVVLLLWGFCVFGSGGGGGGKGGEGAYRSHPISTSRSVELSTGLLLSVCQSAVCVCACVCVCVCERACEYV